MSAAIEAEMLVQLQTLNGYIATILGQVTPAIAKFNSIENNISKIEHLSYILLIVALIFLCCAFVYWFFRHLYPILSKQHTHTHDFNTVTHDMTSVPVRLERS